MEAYSFNTTDHVFPEYIELPIIRNIRFDETGISG